MAYLLIAAKQYEDKTLAGWYNVGPDESGCVSTGRLVELFREKWGRGFEWEEQGCANAPHEDTCLKLDCAKMRSVFDWKPKWSIDQAVENVVRWTRVWQNAGMGMTNQEFISGGGTRMSIFPARWTPRSGRIWGRSEGHGRRQLNRDRVHGSYFFQGRRAAA